MSGTAWRRGGAALSGLAGLAAAALAGWATAMLLGMPGAAGPAAGSGGWPGLVIDAVDHAAPVLLVALGVALGLSAGLSNLGAGGQVVAGGIAASAAAGLVAAPWPLLLLAGGLAGMAAIAIPVVLRVWRGTDEALTTLLIAAMLAAQAPPWPPLALSPPAPLTVGALAISVAGAVWLLGRLTVAGLAVRAIGRDPAAARGAGLPVGRVLLVVGTLSGGLAGLAGAALAVGASPPMLAGTGHAGVVVALLVWRRPLLLPPAALGVGALLAMAAPGVAEAAAAAALLGGLVAMALVRRLRRGS